MKHNGRDETALHAKLYFLMALDVALGDNGWRCSRRELLSHWEADKTSPVASQYVLAYEVTNQYMGRLVSLRPEVECKLKV